MLENSTWAIDLSIGSCTSYSNSNGRRHSAKKQFLFSLCFALLLCVNSKDGLCCLTHKKCTLLAWQSGKNLRFHSLKLGLLLLGASLLLSELLLAQSRSRAQSKTRYAPVQSVFALSKRFRSHPIQSDTIRSDPIPYDTKPADSKVLHRVQQKQQQQQQQKKQQQ